MLTASGFANSGLLWGRLLNPEKAMSVVSYPHSFLSRPEDRAFLLEMNEAGIGHDRSCLICYRMWVDFSTGGSDRRALEAELLEEDRAVRVLESFLGWDGKPGALVRMAISSGFLREERMPGGKAVLICSGFYPINSNWSAKGNAFQRKGALTRVLSDDLKRAEQSVAAQEEIWGRTGGGAFAAIPAEERRAGFVFMNRVCRALRMNVPAEGVLASSGALDLALRVLREHDAKQIDATLMWLLANRQGQKVPDRLDAVLREWQDFANQASAEMGG
jgi:hypothetical protein